MWRTPTAGGRDFYKTRILKWLHNIFRIPDEDLQYIIDAQLSNFESFKIPEKTVQSREVEELEALRNQAKDLYQRQMSSETIEVVTVTATTTEQEETTTDSVLETSTMDDYLLDS